MKQYIYLTFEGFTEDSNCKEVENIQVIGYSKGFSKKDAFKTLKQNNDWILITSFNEIYCHELKDKNFDFFYLKDFK